MGKSLSEWLQEGQQLYDTTLQDYHGLETQLEELEKRLAAKQAEVNQLAGMIGKPPVHGNKRLTAELVDQRNAGPNKAGVAVLMDDDRNGRGRLIR